MVLFLTVGGELAAQETKPLPDLSALGPEAAKEFEDTQNFIDQTRTKIGVFQAQTEARAKEIESLANRVSEIVTSISSKDEDNSNLRSEISVLNELLNLERQTTKQLRTDYAEIQQALKTEIELKTAQQKQYETVLKEKEAALADAELKLDLALESARTHEKTNKNLVNDIDDLKFNIERLNREVALLKKNRYRPKRWNTRPNTP